MREEQKLSLKISIASFVLFIAMILGVYFITSNTTSSDAEPGETTDTETNVSLDDLEFTPIEQPTKTDFSANFVQNKAKINTNFVVDDAEISSNFVTDDSEISPNFVIGDVQSDADSVINNVQFDAVSSPNDIELTEDETYRLAALVQAEADTLYECKTAIASLFLNRMYFYEEGFWETLTREGQFVTDWGTLAYAEPEDESLQAVYDVLENGITIPPYVMFYKIEGYHDWGDQVGWGVIGTTYFSYSQWQREEIEYRLGG